MKTLTMNDEAWFWLKMKIAGMHEAREVEDYEAADDDAFDIACKLQDLMVTPEIPEGTFHDPALCGCAKCTEPAIEKTGHRYDNGMIVEEWRCRECGCTWRDAYAYVYSETPA